MTLTFIISGGFMGLFEEAVRSKLSTGFIRSKNFKVFWERVSAPKDATIYIYGLGWLYATYESARIIIGLFSRNISLFTSFIFGQETSLNPNISAPTEFPEIAFLLAGLILRYYLHIMLLKFSITALIERKRAAFYTALAVHFCTNICLGFLHRCTNLTISYSITAVSLATIVICVLLMKAFALKPAAIRSKN